MKLNITVHKLLIIFVRIVKDGAPRTLFLGNYTVTSGTEECALDKVQEVLHARGIDCQKVIGFGSGGAPVMFRRVSGVGVQLAGVSPFGTHIHCVAHRCALVASNAALCTNKKSNFRTTVNGVYKLFKYSAVRYERLRQLHAALDQSDFQSLKEPCSVRWLSLSKAIESIFANWTSLMLELEEESARGNATASGLRKQIKKYSFVTIAAMLLDILPVMDTLNRFFQQDYISLASVRPRVLMTRGQLQDLLDNKGDNKKKFCNAVGDNMYNGQRLDDVNECAHNTTRDSFIDCLVENLHQRFPGAELDVVVALGKVFDIQRYPAAQEADNYAEDAITVLVDKFGQLAGDDAPALISSNRLKVLFLVQEVTAASWKSNIRRGVSAHYS